MVSNVVERIHADFSLDLLESMRAANETAFLERVKPQSITMPAFEERVEYYRRTYPGSNFVTEKQIEEICLKYKLFFGSLMNFSGTIPVKNRLEIKNFALAPADHWYTDHELPRRIFNQITSETNGSFANGVLTLESGFVPANPNKPFEIAPVGKTFVLLKNPDERSYRIFLKTDILGSPWLIEFGTGRIDYGEIMFYWKQSHGGFAFVPPNSMSLTRPKDVPEHEEIRTHRIINHFVDVVVRFTIQNIQRANQISLTHNVSPMVVGGAAMFDRYKDGTEIVGHRVQFKEGAMSVDNRTYFPIDDPIVLQPVPYGYLVVTKWGNEAMIPEFQNPISN